MNISRIITHPGVFHADDAFAVAILFTLVGKLPVERRDPTPEELDDPTVIVVDVGGRFDVRTMCYDHHQRGFALERDVEEGYGIDGEPNPLAACGLVWTQFPKLMELKGDYSSEEQNLFHQRMDSMLVRGVDATDCGKAAHVVGSCASLSAAIHWMNPIGSAMAEDRHEAFMAAVGVATDILAGAAQTVKAWIDGRRTVLEAERYNQHTVVLTEYAPWQEHLFQRPDQEELLYVIFPSERGGYMVQQVPVAPDSFDGRKPLPEAWAGLRGEELAEINGIEDSIFCHPGRFCGAAESLESAIKMADLAAAS
jgi:uncharacterized UPF0160 family protein